MKIADDLYTHMEWADAHVWRVALALPAAREDEALQRTLIHIHTVQRAFLAMWTGQQPAFFKRADFEDLEAMARWAREGHALLQARLAELSPADLDAPLILPWAERIASILGHPPHPSSMLDTVIQVPSHSTYHRGQANARIRALGGEPPLVDYIAWIWGGRGEAKWSV